LKPGEVDVKDREDQTALRNSSFTSKQRLKVLVRLMYQP
jgi:hypothetical protein